MVESLRGERPVEAYAPYHEKEDSDDGNSPRGVGDTSDTMSEGSAVSDDDSSESLVSRIFRPFRSCFGTLRHVLTCQSCFREGSLSSIMALPRRAFGWITFPFLWVFHLMTCGRFQTAPEEVDEEGELETEPIPGIDPKVNLEELSPLERARIKSKWALEIAQNFEKTSGQRCVAFRDWLSHLRWLEHNDKEFIPPNVDLVLAHLPDAFKDHCHHEVIMQGGEEVGWHACDFSNKKKIATEYVEDHFPRYKIRVLMQDVERTSESPFSRLSHYLGIGTCNLSPDLDGFGGRERKEQLRKGFLKLPIEPINYQEKIEETFKGLLGRSERVEDMFGDERFVQAVKVVTQEELFEKWVRSIKTSSTPLRDLDTVLTLKVPSYLTDHNEEKVEAVRQQMVYKAFFELPESVRSQVEREVKEYPISRRNSNMFADGRLEQAVKELTTVS